MKAPIGVDADSGLVHTVRGTTDSVNGVTEANALLHGDEAEAFGDAGYQGADKRADAKPDVRWNIAMRPSNAVMRVLPVVVMNPSRQRAGFVAGVLVGLAVRPLSQRRLNKTLGLAVCLWTVAERGC